MTKIIMIHDLPDDPNNPDGPTIREANLKKEHQYPIGTLIEVKYDTWFGEGACEKTHARLWIVGHHRDCDGTPLYALCSNRLDMLGPKYKLNEEELKSLSKLYRSGFAEEDLTPVEITNELKRGYDALEWEEDNE